MNETMVDVLIVGGGIAGVGCAAMLPDTLSVVLLESESQCGYHSTGRSAAAWVAGYGGPEIRELTRNSKSYLAVPPVSLNEESFLTSRGEMLIARNEVEQDALQQQIASIDHLQQISVSEACDRVPALNAVGLKTAAFTPEAYDIDADRLLQAWLRKIKQRGANVSIGQPVTVLQRMADHWRVTCLGGEVLLARTVVNAAGAWADQVASLAGLAPLGLIAHRRSAALLPASTEHDVSTWPLIISADETWYARPIGGSLMVSPADETAVTAHDAFAEDLTIAEGLDRFEQAVNFTVKQVTATWAGLRTFAPDRVPVVGNDPRCEGFFWLAGQGGYGIQTAPELSRLAAVLICGDAIAESDSALCESLSPARLLVT